MPVPGVVTIKTFTYRGAPEDFSNSYLFAGSAPATPVDWRALVDALAGYEAAALTDLVTIYKAYCYDDLTATHPSSVYTYDMLGMSTEVTGIVSSTGHSVAPGDAAAWIRWRASYNNSHGKPVYLRKYMHSVLLGGTTGDAYDNVLAAQRSGLASLGSDLLASVGAWPGLVDPHGGTPTDPVASTYVTTRTLERRGRRP